MTPTRIAFALLILMALLPTQWLAAQDFSGAAMTYFQNNAEKYGASRQDMAQLIVTDVIPTDGDGIQIIYLRQGYQGIGIYGAEMSLAFKDGVIFNEWAHTVSGVKAKVNTMAPVLNQMQAIAAAAKHFGWAAPKEITEIADLGTADLAMRYTGGNLSEEEIPVRLVFVQSTNGTLQLAWDFNILPPKGDHWWSLKVDATTGDVLEQLDWTTHCRFDGGSLRYDKPIHTEICQEDASALFLAPPPNSYNVFKEPVESPNHGARSYATNPWNTTYSPFGWHDTNGATGNEYTITRGNNVWAMEDANGNDGTGTSPDGGATLNFDFPLNLNGQPNTYQAAAVTNLFYWNNKMHDVWAKYGFDAPGGNFQQNNYSMGGLASDYVQADAQDGSGMDNANFATPVDGTKPRMQMYLWTGQQTVNFLVNSPPAWLATTIVCLRALAPRFRSFRLPKIWSWSTTAPPTPHSVAMPSPTAVPWLARSP